MRRDVPIKLRQASFPGPAQAPAVSQENPAEGTAEDVSSLTMSERKQSYNSSNHRSCRLLRTF